MMKKSASIFLALSIFFGSIGSVMAEDNAGPLAAENFSATLYFTTDYVFRGISFSDSLPALQGSFDWGYSNFFAGAWSSSLADAEGESYDLETDFYAGYANSFAGFDWFVMPIYYHIWGSGDEDVDAFFGTTGDLDPDVFEVWVDVTRSFEAPLSPTFHVLYAYTPDYFFSSGTGHYIKGDITLSLPWGVSLNGGYGHQTAEGGDFGDPPPTGFGTGGFDYGHWEVGLSKSLVGFDFDLRYHEVVDDSTTDQLVTDFLGSTENVEDRLVFTISRSF